MSCMPPSGPATRTLGDHLIRVVKLLQAAKQSTAWVNPAVDPFHYPILFRIWSQPQRLSDLATALHADVSTTSRQVSHLTSLGLVHKLPYPADGRAHLLGITDAGTDLLVALQRDRDERLEAVLSHWDSADRDQFAHYLERFADDLSDVLDELRTPAPARTSTSQESA